MANVYYRIKGKSDNESIYLQLTIDRDNRFEKKIGLNIASKEWSKNSKLPKQNSAQNKKTGNDLRKLQTYILDEVNESQVVGEIINSKWLEKRIDIHFKRISPSGESELVTDAINHVINTAPHRKGQRGNIGLSKTRIAQYKSLRRLFGEFQGSRTIKVREIDIATANTFYQFLNEECHYSESYSLKMVDNLKTVCRDAQSLGIPVSPQLHKIGGGKPKNAHIIYLSPAELQKISSVTLEQEYLDNARKWLLLGCFIGQRVSDLLQISESNFVEHEGKRYIELQQKKTGKNVVIPVLKETEKIIVDGLPRQISSQNLNKYIKEVCRLAGITQPVEGSLTNKKKGRKEIGIHPKYKLVASHVCRRSFATNFYGKLPTAIIMQVTGHSSEKTFLNYIGKSNVDFAKQFFDLYDQLSLT